MGGWGPYTVREIEVLFNLHGFEETVSAPEEQGVRRQTAADFIGAIDWDDSDSRSRLLRLIAEVLHHYPPQDGESPLSPGRALRGALERAGIVPTALESQTTGPVLDTVPGAADPGPQADDPFDIWPADRVRVFMSHLATDREFVQAVATELERSAFACFVAHEEIRPSLRWQEVIESALDSCNLMVAFVADGFKDSDWCAQEVGWALGRGLVLVPVAIDMQPYGFFGSFQAVQTHHAAPVQTAIQVGHAIAIAVFRGQRPDSARLVEPLADSVIDAFCASGSFDTARRRFELLRQIPPVAWTPDRRERIETACRDNRQLRDANLAGGESMPEAVAGLLP
jgi:hypothetical protein